MSYQQLTLVQFSQLNTELNYAEFCILSAWTTHRKNISVLLCGADHIQNTTSYIVVCWNMFTELLPSNALLKSVMIPFLVNITVCSS
jgi:hypothetical protein